ncbi:hypothetical protein GCM10023149_44160 [Mucilaginibacter gynuensis]|uniref:WGR domain-containing protein n=1 Tax=Mucilaginibacter gynuensis TaxID=1302236 RepID=A0ABP8H8L4_9SPHI
MLKLYKRVGDTLHYWETWDKNSKAGIIHWGIVGQTGEGKEVASGLLANFRKKIQEEVDQKLKDGYAQIDTDEHYTLLIEYTVDGMGTAEDVEKRTRLQDKMDEVLGWTGLGHCDGGSIGSGTMEVCCLVVDFDVAKHVIGQALKDTEFANYTRIFDEDNE